jgi:hypothetical protein
MTYPHPTDAADRGETRNKEEGREKQRRDDDDLTQMMRETKQSQ